MIQGRVYVPYIGELRKHIMDEAHNLPYGMHPRSTKMYRNIKPLY